MSIQDDIFDVQAALKDKPEAEAFERIYTAFAENETDLAEANEKLTVVNRFRALLNEAVA